MPEIHVRAEIVSCEICLQTGDKESLLMALSEIIAVGRL
jgi:hypothetical protein